MHDATNALVIEPLVRPGMCCREFDRCDRGPGATPRLG